MHVHPSTIDSDQTSTSAASYSSGTNDTVEMTTASNISSMWKPYTIKMLTWMHCPTSVMGVADKARTYQYVR